MNMRIQKKKKTKLNSALDLNAIGTWVSGGLSFATKKNYKMKFDKTSVYIAIDNDTQLVITPKDLNTGTIVKQTKQGNDTLESDPITYKTSVDCLKQITKMLSTNSNRNLDEVDDYLFSVSSSLRRAFSKPPKTTINANRKSIKLNNNNQLQDSVTSETQSSTLKSNSIIAVTEELKSKGISWEEFEMIAFNDPANPGTCVLAFYDDEEGVFVGTILDGMNPGIVEQSPDAFLEHFPGTALIPPPDPIL